VVLEVGPGAGSQLDRFDKSKIDHIYGVELNPAFASPLLAEVERAKLQGKYTLIPGAVEDESLLTTYGLNAGSVDSIVCVGTLCSVSDPEQTMRWMYALLKPGGAFIFWEHRRSHDFLTRLVQGIPKPHFISIDHLLTCLELWNPLWRYIMGGCSLNRLKEDIIFNAGDWDLQASEIKVQDNPASEWSLMPRVEGRLIKRV
jgi:SAM-dependent methyltransferase